MVRRVDIAPHLIIPMGVQAHTEPTEPSSPEAVVIQVNGFGDERFPRRRSVQHQPSPVQQARLHEDDSGGFPRLRQLGILRRVFPRLDHKLRRTVMMPQAEAETLIPSAMCSVHSISVYEENLLGIYSEGGSNEDEDAAGESCVAIWGKHLMRHARIQLSFVFEEVSANGTVGLSLGEPNVHVSRHLA
ncbi:hypothetical protein OBBRIDRAFT_837461 [Obba rivulosa]|uniref:Uncharacterized protein n=1 Tax=Obba rivulosa TaxID=1052685 RepID=A0A8E2AMC4_9APHY|nr:hypothetical protein OBBRIDRAFT_837461 [Obba rivulosa]